MATSLRLGRALWKPHCADRSLADQRMLTDDNTARISDGNHGLNLLDHGNTGTRAIWHPGLIGFLDKFVVSILGFRRLVIPRGLSLVEARSRAPQSRCGHTMNATGLWPHKNLLVGLYSAEGRLTSACHSRPGTVTTGTPGHRDNLEFGVYSHRL